MKAHVIAIEGTQWRRNGAQGMASRWFCSCGCIGEWKLPVGRKVTPVGRPSVRPYRSAERRARDGGARHVAAMERSKP